MQNGNQIHIRSRQKCKTCGSYFKPSRNGLECPNHPGSHPTRFLLDFYDANGNRVIEPGYGSYDAAFDRAQEIRQLFKTNQFRIKDFQGARKNTRKKYHVDNIIAEYLEDLKDKVSNDGTDESGLSPGSYKSIAQHLNEFSQWTMTVEQLIDIRRVGTYEIKQFDKYLKGERIGCIRGKKTILPGNKAKTRRNKMADIQAFFKTLPVDFGTDYMPTMPVFPKISFKTPEIKTMDLEARQKAINEIPDEHKPIFLFMKENKLRPAEARAIKRDCLFPKSDPPYIHISRGFSLNQLRDLTKTKNDWYVPLDDANRNIINMAMPSLQTDFVFYWADPRNSGKHKPYMEQMLRNIWGRACDDAGVKHVTIYNAFRHTGITEWLDDGMHEEDASALVGHKCRSTIKKYDKSKRVTRLLKAKRMVQ